MLIKLIHTTLKISFYYNPSGDVLHGKNKDKIKMNATGLEPRTT